MLEKFLRFLKTPKNFSLPYLKTKVGLILKSNPQSLKKWEKYVIIVFSGRNRKVFVAKIHKKKTPSSLPWFSCVFMYTEYEKIFRELKDSCSFIIIHMSTDYNWNGERVNDPMWGSTFEIKFELRCSFHLLFSEKETQSNHTLRTWIINAFYHPFQVF